MTNLTGEVYDAMAAGKEAMTSGVGAFNKAASWSYEQLSVEEKERLRAKAESSGSAEITPIDVQHREASVFKKIRECKQQLTPPLPFIHHRRSALSRHCSASAHPSTKKQ